MTGEGVMHGQDMLKTKYLELAMTLINISPSSMTEVDDFIPVLERSLQLCREIQQLEGRKPEDNIIRAKPII